MGTGSIALTLLLSFAFVVRGASNGTPVQVAHKLFDAMKAHDSAAATVLFLPGATLGSVDTTGQATVTPAEQFVKHIGMGNGEWVERIWNPKVLEQGPIAVVWAEYDFHLNGKFTHCGIDSFSMLKTVTGWKIASVSDTRQTAGCPSRTPGAR